ncbi:MAG: DJ-1/PfpI family protein [Cyclobacteriaceae bacterium]|nr:DJ-1/PfpI family protein [Cyclobacteriaceae bacterium]
MKCTFTWCLVFGLAMMGCKQSQDFIAMGPPVLPSAQLNVAFLAVEGVYNSELIAPMDVMHHTVFHPGNGMKVFIVAPSRDTLTTFEGLKIIPDYSFLRDSLPRIDVLVVPSAQNSMDSDLENTDLIEFVRRTTRSASYIMSLCDGAFVLAKAGVLDAHECTTFPGDIARFKEIFPQLVVHEGVSFVHDRKVITSAGGAKSYDPALYLVELLYGKETADGIARGLVIDWQVANVKRVITSR